MMSFLRYLAGAVGVLIGLLTLPFHPLLGIMFLSLALLLLLKDPS